MEVYYITDHDKLNQKPKEFTVAAKKVGDHIYFHMHFDYERLHDALYNLHLGGESSEDGSKTTVGYHIDNITYYFEVDGSYGITYDINKDYIEGVLRPISVHEEDGWVDLEMHQKVYSEDKGELVKVVNEP